MRERNAGWKEGGQVERWRKEQGKIESDKEELRWRKRKGIDK